MSLAFWICGIVALVSAFVSLGYAIAGLRSAHEDAVTPSRYALVRSIALAAITAAALFSGSSAFVVAGAAAMVIVQAGDAVVGVLIKDRLKTYGPAVTAIVGLAALLWVMVW